MFNTNAITEEVGKKDGRATKHDSITLIINKFGVFFMIIILCIAGMVISDQFMTIQNLTNILDAVAVLGIVSAGVAFVIFCGQYGDMSVPTVMALSGIIAIEFLRFGIVISVLAGILSGVAVGLINGYVVGKLRVNAIIWTLAVNFMVDGTIRWVYKGTQIYPDVQNAETFSKGFFLPLIAKIFPSIKDADITSKAETFGKLSRTYISGVPLMIVIMLVIMAIFYFIMSKTTFGNQLKLVGSNYLVAKMTGIKSTKVIAMAFITSSVAAAIAGIFYTSLTKVGAYYNGAGYDFSAVTAIILGGMSLSGGRGSIIGVFGGVVTLGIISNILTLLGMGTFAQQMIKGLIFIVVVAVNTKSLRKLGRDDA
ncbi:MAG: ABC transporter permease [Vallitaleaceae bacterium]|nr:ABC transporter permease [Vallitaleaceae bacterium]